VRNQNLRAVMQSGDAGTVAAAHVCTKMQKVFNADDALIGVGDLFGIVLN
jgi:hypothetical protein